MPCNIFPNKNLQEIDKKHGPYGWGQKLPAFRAALSVFWASLGNSTLNARHLDYHILLSVPSVERLLKELGQLHGRTAHRWNGADDRRGRKVWCKTAERRWRTFPLLDYGKDWDPPEL